MKSLSFIDELLAEQRQLTAVERFAQRHQPNPNSRSRHYQDLLPVRRPAGGEQYAFRVDLDLCTGCKACVSACHSLNGLDENETWRAVGLLHGGRATEPYQQTVTAACHHCVEPACLEGCPVLAYEKDLATGIVRHLDDQCIGCQYCVLKCPYDVPKYSSRRGIVRKCDMCYERVVAGEPPACVQACPSEAISIQIVSQPEIADACEAPQKRLLPGAFPSDYTLPTTSYVSRKPFPANCEPADANTLDLESPHWPLVWMLVLTQAAAGVFGAAWLAALKVPAYEAAVRIFSFVGCLLLCSGLAASVFHLGRPLRAWRAFLGWRKSWMSREIIAFGIWAALALGLLLFGRGRALALAAGAAAGIGFLAVVCSAMIYVDTRRTAWNVGAVFVRFMGTAFLLGASISAGCLAWAAALGRLEFAEAGRWAALLATAIRIALFGWEASGLRRASNLPNYPRTRFARILSHRLPGLIQTRAALFFIATFFGLSGVGLSGVLGAACATISLLSTLAAQVAERYCFFVAAGKPGMPGGVPG